MRVGDLLPGDLVVRVCPPRFMRKEVRTSVDTVIGYIVDEAYGRGCHSPLVMHAVVKTVSLWSNTSMEFWHEDRGEGDNVWYVNRDGIGVNLAGPPSESTTTV